MTSDVTSGFGMIEYVFLDRDGVINRKPPEGEYVSSWEQFHLLPGVETAIAALNRSGRCVIVVTNQRGVALGLYTTADVEAIHRRLNEHLAPHGAKIDTFYYCPHDKNQCECRKPRTGLFEEAFRDFPGASASNSIILGDSVSDMEAARTLGMPAIFIEGDPDTRKPGAAKAVQLANAVASSLEEAVQRYLL